MGGGAEGRGNGAGDLLGRLAPVTARTPGYSAAAKGHHTITAYSVGAAFRDRGTAGASLRHWR
ncbi:hypothetical protein [Streptomyces sp. NPDC019937]|uniref:hypothetical protein n=1 Tax=Streptomyces sp. NPDC019937 TaxID=3154787 RepID=UPI0033DEAAAB